MRTKNQRRNGARAARRVIVKGKPMVMMDEGTYKALLRKADLWEPDMPTETILP
jgi:hypothetical protein